MIDLAAGSSRLTIDPDAGARLTSLIAGGRERLVGPSPNSTPAETLWGCFPMAPWAGRIAGARLDWGSETFALHANLRPHAIHGVVFDEVWTVDEATESSASLTCELDPARWPPGGRVRQHLKLSEGALELEGLVEATAKPMPAAFGWHPWFLRPEQDDMRVQVLSGRVLETASDLIPTGEIVRATGATDLRGGPILGGRRLDHVYVFATSPAVVSWPDLQLRIIFEDPIETIVVHTPEAGVCVEPQSAWPDASALYHAGVRNTGLASLQAGEGLQARVRWEWD